METSKIQLADGTSVVIRRGRQPDVIPYLTACQQAAEQAYHRPELGVNLFTKEHYFHTSALKVWHNLTKNDEVSRWWVAEHEASGEIIGGIGLKKYPAHTEGWGLYVLPSWQGKGIGSELMRIRRSAFSGPILFEVYAHAEATIAFHERKGAAPTGNQRLIHWDSWPDNLNLTALEYMSNE